MFIVFASNITLVFKSLCHFHPLPTKTKGQGNKGGTSSLAFWQEFTLLKGTFHIRKGNWWPFFLCDLLQHWDTDMKPNFWLYRRCVCVCVHVLCLPSFPWLPSLFSICTAPTYFFNWTFRTSFSLHKHMQLKYWVHNTPTEINAIILEFLNVKHPC